MVKSYKNITNKYLAHNKKRTILTICGIILSVALITSIGLFIKSFQNSFVEETKNSVGSFHGILCKNDNEVYDKITKNPKIGKVGRNEILGEAELKSSKHIEINKFDKSALELLPYKAIKGRLPEKEGEIALESWILNYIDNFPKTGDIVKLKLNNRLEKKFKIVGLIMNNSFNQYKGKSLGIVFSNNFNIEKSQIYFTVSEKANIKNTIKELGETFKGLKTNEELLRFLGQASDKSINNSLYSMAAIIISIVVIATIAVIYNSFQISVVERIKQFGLLRAVGATPMQVRKLVLREAFIVSIIGIPIGILSGIFAIYILCIVFNFMSTSAFSNMSLVISYPIITISALIGLLAVYVSALIPARFAGKISPMVAISSRNSIIKEKIKKRRGRVVKKILSINGLMAYKNIKRNRKRFNITVFSITISITLFIFFSSFINMITNFDGGESEESKFQFRVEGLIDKNKNSSLNENFINKIKSNENVKEVYMYYPKYESKAILKEKYKSNDISKIQPDIYNSIQVKGKNLVYLNTTLDVYDSNKFKDANKYLSSGNIDEEKINKENGIIIIESEMFKNKGKYYKMPITSLTVGDSLYIDKNLHIVDSDKNKKINIEDNNLVKVKVIAIVKNPPYDLFTLSPQLRCITSKQVMENMLGKNMEDMTYVSMGIVLKDKNTEDEFEKWIRPLGDNNGVKVINTLKQNEETSDTALQMKILMYGFIAVISLIGVVNIVNTVTTNLILRRREIASLSAIGMTYKNIRSMILKEGVLYGLYGAVYGSIIGTILSYMIASPMRELLEFKWPIPWMSIFIATTTSIFIGVIAIIKPLNKIKKENIVEVIRGE
ncbi:ABC transporter permease [Clostridium rectalis]|uniref:ABC transporter permease n=1 Tax=Clostridium rectalis TaxID=2040295 RepID=UPI001FAA74CA|nr:FtsX-like permease family protein [Clostridium rectalis]